MATKLEFKAERIMRLSPGCKLFDPAFDPTQSVLFHVSALQLRAVAPTAPIWLHPAKRSIICASHARFAGLLTEARFWVAMVCLNFHIWVDVSFSRDRNI